ncbi:hypothetical protein F4678DRAFT_448187 [Xylaria arbuscula]|nr:hypothetical protein F4678DRAFT_448187 [Xylaria arbuscula]
MPSHGLCCVFPLLFFFLNGQGPLSYIRWHSSSSTKLRYPREGRRVETRRQAGLTPCTLFSCRRIPVFLHTYLELALLAHAALR